MTRRPAAILLSLLLAASALLPAFARPEAAAAHPLGNFTVNRYARLELYRDAVDVHYVLDVAEIPTFQLLDTIDPDGNGASAEELAAYAAEVARTLPRNFDLTLEGRHLEVTTLSSDARLVPGQGGLETLRLAVVYRAPVEATSEARDVTFTDRNYADRIGWKEIVVRPSEGSAATVEESLTRDLSSALQDYPQSALSSAPSVSNAAFEWQPGSGLAAPETAALLVAAASKAGGIRFDTLLSHRGSLTVVLASLAAAFGFGMLHALGPGHGKTVVAAYLVGSRGTVRHAFALGITVTATHTSMVYLLGFVTIAASAFIVPERLYLYLGLISGVSVIAMGAGLFATRLRGLRPSEGEHRHGLFGRPHSHAPASVVAPEVAGHPHSHEREEHPHVDSEEVHAVSEAADPPRITWRGLLTLGVIGGLLPCPSALLVMLAAISLGQVLYGMLLIVAFSLGLAGVLTGIGVSLVLGKRLSRLLPTAALARHPSLTRALVYLPAASALGITAAGFLMTYQAMQQFGV